MQGVSCRLIFAQDHTHEATKNCYQKKGMSANALWDVATETGEIAAAVLVPTTKTVHYSHAATRLAQRNGFNPAAMCSDTWPAKSDYWNLLFHKQIEGRLCLFHFIQRITKTLKKNHADHFSAVTALLTCICQHNEVDYENLLRALKEGTLSGTKHSDEDITELKVSRLFRQRYDKHLQKEIRAPHTLCSMLDDWFDRCKCTSGDVSCPERGRLDPVTGETLFSSQTKEAVLNGKDEAAYLQDPLTLDEMYHTTHSSPNSPHQLKEHLSR